MQAEAPMFRRCCICLPLRYGLIMWGYLKLCTSCLVLTLFIYYINDIFGLLKTAKESRHIRIFNVIVLCFAGFVALVDLALTIAFIVGCYKKNVKLLRIYFYHSSVLLALTTAFSVYLFFVAAYSMYEYYTATGLNVIPRIIVYEILDILVQFGNVSFQAYILLLLRSEIKKLNNRTEFRFVNHAAGAECTLHMNNKNEEQGIININKDLNDDGELRYA